MPELPEVELASQRLREQALHATVASVTVRHASQRRHLPLSAQRALAGRRIDHIARRAKVQLLHLDDASVLEVHFRMTGDWEFTAAEAPPPAHARVTLTLDSGRAVHLVDPRALSVVRRHAPHTFRGIDAGPEPLDPAFTADVLRAALATRRGPIKAVLLDQHVVAGVGNIYAAEALWEARIAPHAPAQSLSPARVARLRDAIVHVLRHAPATRYYARTGTRPGEQEKDRANAPTNRRTRDRANESGAPTTVAPPTIVDDAVQAWRVYGRTGEPCDRCGSRLQHVALAGRGTWWCGRCQR